MSEDPVGAFFEKFAGDKIVLHEHDADPIVTISEAQEFLSRSNFEGVARTS